MRAKNAKNLTTAPRPVSFFNGDFVVAKSN